MWFLWPLLAHAEDACPEDAATCAQATELLAALPQLADAQRTPLERTPQKAVVSDVTKAAQPCYRALLATEEHTGWLDVIVAADAAGAPVAMSLQGDGFPDRFLGCVAETVGQLRHLPPSPGPQWVHARIHLAHMAVLDLRPQDGSTHTSDHTTVMKGMASWAEPLEACGVGGGIPTQPAHFDLRITQGGQPKGIKLAQSCGLPAVDQCMLEALQTLETKHTMSSPKIHITASLMQPVQEAP
jgi:hypothetical protein